MFTKIEEEKPESQPQPNQYIAFKLGELLFAGVYLGDKKANPFSINNAPTPIVIIEEWMPLRLWL